jgi:hypothetical protein
MLLCDCSRYDKTRQCANIPSCRSSSRRNAIAAGVKLRQEESYQQPPQQQQPHQQDIFNFSDPQIQNIQLFDGFLLPESVIIERLPGPPIIISRQVCSI